MKRIFLCAGALILLCAARVPAQGTAPAAPTPALPSYPSNDGGLKRLMRDALDAAKRHDAAFLQAWADSMILPQSDQWFAENFFEPWSARLNKHYEDTRRTIAPAFFAEVEKLPEQGYENVEVYSRELSYILVNDAKEGERHYVRLRKPAHFFAVKLPAPAGKETRLIWHLVHTQGAFHYLGNLTPAEVPAASPEATRPQNTPAGDGGEKKPDRVKFGGSVQAAKLLKSPRPVYPEQARDARVQGTVRLRAVISQEGEIYELWVASGSPLLIEAAVDAVFQWRYAPTLLEGKPVEVLTTIDIVFQLQR